MINNIFKIKIIHIVFTTRMHSRKLILGVKSSFKIINILVRQNFTYLKKIEKITRNILEHLDLTRSH